MGQIDFHRAKLWYSLRSPFARRVRLAFIENEVVFEDRVCDVFKPTPDLFAANPLGRVPILELESGEILIESQIILQFFYAERVSPWMPKSQTELLEVSQWSGLSLGLSEKCVEFYLDTLRPKDHRDPELAEELSQIMERVLSRSEDRLKKQGGQQLVGSRLSQADLDFGTALGYLSLRYTSEWKNRFPTTHSYWTRLETRPSFQKTAPPPA